MTQESNRLDLTRDTSDQNFVDTGATSEHESPTRKNERAGGLVNAAQKRQERIKRLEARLQREKARDNVASRKERNGQLYVWGATVEGVYRDGNAEERKLLKQWMKRILTDKRHLQRAESGFARVDAENVETATDLAECDT